MHLHTRNVNTAFYDLVNGTAMGGWRVECRPSRNGPVIVIDEPVLVTYSHPTERVLFNTARDANPFFHLYHSLWLLAGRNDIAAPAFYVKKYADYSDDGVTANGSYGHRWRRAFAFPNGYDEGDPRQRYDQLDILVNHLKADPTSRRAVLQMWNVEDDLLKIGGKCLLDGEYHKSCNNDPGSRDVCCNLSVMFSLREHRRSAQGISRPDAIDRYLDMTVTNRSNDMIWGMLGEDYCTFTFLQEYMAARLGVEVGKYHHFTNNLHVYENNWKPVEWLKDAWHDFYGQCGDGFFVPKRRDWQPNWAAEWLPGKTIPLVKDPAQFEKELPLIVETFSGNNPHRQTRTHYDEPFLMGVAYPMLTAFGLYKSGDLDRALERTNDIRADDWRVVARNWVQRRITKRKEKMK